MDHDEVVKYWELEASSPHDKPIGLHGHVTDSAIGLYVEQACPDFEAEIQSHLAICTKCQQVVEEVRKALAEDDANPERAEAAVERIVALLESQRATKQ
jgi:bacterioferritin-associated ferredoxin